MAPYRCRHHHWVVDSSYVVWTIRLPRQADGKFGSIVSQQQDVSPDVEQFLLDQRERPILNALQHVFIVHVAPLPVDLLLKRSCPYRPHRQLMDRISSEVKSYGQIIRVPFGVQDLRK